MNPSESNSAKSVQFLEIDPEYAGQRIDNFLFTHLKGVPKSHIYRIIRTGEVRRNGGRIHAQDRLVAGDRIRVPPIRVSEAAAVPELATGVLPRIESRILFEDDDMMIINKPSGMAVHGGSGISYGLIEALREMRPRAKSLELVHRLDRDTSGCLLVAKKRSALKHLHEQFRSDQVEKCYLALLAGVWPKARLTVDAPLKKNILQSGERMVKVSAEGKSAVTVFVRAESYQKATLVQAKPVTGRTHQIRVHAQHLGHGILGDERYGDQNANREFRQLGLKRLFLHAESTRFRHPRTSDMMRFEAPLDAELSAFLKSLPK